MSKGTASLIVLGQHVYVPAEDTAAPWMRLPFSAPDELVQQLTERAPAVVEAKRVRLIYEPTSLASEEVEAPRVSRRQMQQIPELRDRHPALGSDHLAWGYQPNWVSGGRSKTILHTEGTTGLLTLSERLGAMGLHVEGAWPAASLSVGHRAGRPFCMLMLDDAEAFLYVEAKGQRVPMKLGAGLSVEETQREIRGRLDAFNLWRDAEALVWSNVPPAMIASLIPWWNEWLSVSHITVEPFGSISFKKFSLRDTSNLMLAFPQPFDAAPLTRWITTGAVVATIAVGVYQYYQLTRAQQERDEVVAALSIERGNLELAKARKTEQGNLSKMYGDELTLSVPSRRGLLIALAQSLPTNLSVSQLDVSTDGTFRISGVAWQAAADATRAQVLDPVIAQMKAKMPEIIVEPSGTNYEPERKQWSLVGRLQRVQGTERNSP
ncbi:hypothetical protein [Oleiharenicola sp. Vm1]|uniref:hypothetical protein n=1 Tax=Oleiharenicola sp. Vm1 TaxID=3398393 RepID=UPI0039F4FBE7